MKILTLEKIKYKNILSVGSKPIEVDLKTHHKTLITGTNGTGKSTMLEAICFALFGKPFRDIKKAQLINSVNKKDMLTELWFSYGSDSYYVKRGQKPTVFEVQKNGVQIDEDASVKDFQEKFEQMIGMSMHSFKSTVVLGTAGYTPFMQLKTPDRRRLVEDLLQTDILGIMDKLNKTYIREINQNISVLDLKKESLEAQLKAQKDFAEKQAKMSTDNIDRYKALYDQQITEAKENKARIQELNQKLETLVLDDNPKDKHQKLLSEYASLKSKRGTYNQVVSLYDKGGSCPTCMQDLSDRTKVWQISESITVCDHSLSALSESIAESEKEVESYNEKARLILSTKQEIKSLTESIMKSVENAKKISALIEQSSNEKIDNSDKINAISKDIGKIVEEKSDLVLEKYNRSVLTDMLKDTGIKGAIISKYVPLFNKQINQYLKLLGADYLFTLDEEFNETIKSRGRESFSYYSFSQGEKARIDIALLFTWRDIASMVSGIKISTLFLDEIFDGAADVEAIKGINSILSSMKDQNIFIISHRDHDPQDYGQHLQMKKVGRFTVL